MPMPSPEAGLETALDQRRRRLDQERQVLAERELVVQQQTAALAAAEARVRAVTLQMEAAQQPTSGVALPVALLGDLERLLEWCTTQVAAERERLGAVCAEADEARGAVVNAHQQVRALELVLEARAAERAEKQRRIELREADEIAARVHQNGVVSR
jgi:flagellar FliJ-like protein